MHTHIQPSIRSPIHLCINVYMHTRMCMCMNACMEGWMHMSMHVYVYVCMYVHKQNENSLSVLIYRFSFSLPLKCFKKFYPSMKKLQWPSRERYENALVNFKL